MEPTKSGVNDANNAIGLLNDSVSSIISTPGINEDKYVNATVMIPAIKIKAKRSSMVHPTLFKNSTICIHFKMRDRKIRKGLFSSEHRPFLNL